MRSSEPCNFCVGPVSPRSPARSLASQADVLYDFFNPASRIGGDYAGTTSTEWEALTPKGVGGWHGPEITFAAAVKAALRGERTAVVKVAAAGSNIVEHWARGAAPDSEYPEKSQLYHALLGKRDSAEHSRANDNALFYPAEATRLDAALERLTERGDSYRLGCVLWVQGENESTWSAAFEYEAKLSGLVSALREDMGEPQLPFVIGRTALQTGQAMGGPVPDANLAAVRAAQEAAAANDTYIELVDMDDLPGAGDNLHFAPAGYRTLGERLAAACLAILDIEPGGPTTSGSGGADAAAGGASASDGDLGDDGCSTRPATRGARVSWLRRAWVLAAATEPRRAACRAPIRTASRLRAIQDRRRDARVLEVLGECQASRTPRTARGVPRAAGSALSRRVRAQRVAIAGGRPLCAGSPRRRVVAEDPGDRGGHASAPPEFRRSTCGRHKRLHAGPAGFRMGGQRVLVRLRRLVQWRRPAASRMPPRNGVA